MPGNPLVRFDEGRGGRTFSVALSPTLPRNPSASRLAGKHSLLSEIKFLIPFE